MDDGKFEHYFALLHTAIQDARAEARADNLALRAEMNARFEVSDTRLAELSQRFEQFRVETNERLQSVFDRLGLVEKRLDRAFVAIDELRTEVRRVAAESVELRGEIAEMRGEIAELRGDFAGFTDKIVKVESRVDRVQSSINSLSDDMRQRFRLVNERLAG
jgi:chromosome segregation ATPase